MSSPAEQLASVNSVPIRNSNSLQSNTAQTQTTSGIADQSAIADQAAADVNQLNAENSSGLDTAPVNADQPVTDADVMVGKKNIAAAKSSIFASPDASTATPVVEPQQVALNGIENGQQPAQKLDAASSSIYAGQVDAAPRDTASIPLPDAKAVSEVQDLALAGLEVPPELQQQAAAVAVDAADPELAEQALKLTASSVLDADPAQDIAAPQVAVEQIQPVKKKRTLADFFRRNTETAAFDAGRFGKKKNRVIDTSAIPNMQTAALSDDQLPGINANALFASQGISDDEHSEGDDQPVGLMQLASLSGMARLAPNGLWTQTERVEVRCLRPQLVSMLKSVEDHYKRPVIVTSGFRDARHNRRAGGVRHSLHTLCAAADIQVQGVSKWALADYLRSIPGRGGVGTYCHTDSVHIDVGGERDWNWRCRRMKHRRS